MYGVSQAATKSLAENCTVALSSPTVVFVGSKNSQTCRAPAAKKTGSPSGVLWPDMLHTWKHPLHPSAYHPPSSTGHSHESASRLDQPSRTVPYSAFSTGSAIVSPPAESPVEPTPHCTVTAVPAGTTCAGSTCAGRNDEYTSSFASTLRSTCTRRSSKYAALRTNPSVAASGNRGPTVSLRGVKKNQISATASGPITPTEAAVVRELFGFNEQATSPTHGPAACQHFSAFDRSRWASARFRDPGSTNREATRVCSEPTDQPVPETDSRSHSDSPLQTVVSGACATAENRPCTRIGGRAVSCAKSAPIRTTVMFKYPIVSFAGVSHRYSFAATPDNTTSASRIEHT
ncbi:hypothetical protein DIPPA_17251 [Diplonema papillatum]|nr:hypothetical protein DIPPA_17251 [Diplonema papillatum]